MYIKIIPMRKISFLSFIIAFPCLLSYAQGEYDPEAVRLLKEDLSRSGNNMHHYEYAYSPDTPAPDGYEAFYVSHYGRHGCRRDNNCGRFLSLRERLESARTAGLLTPAGEAVYEEVCLVAASAENMTDQLTARGISEHASIAERMIRRFPSVFNGEKKIRSVASIVPRCILSQNAFTNSLLRNNPQLYISLDTGEKYMEYLTNPGIRDKEDSVRAIITPLIREYEKRYAAFDTVSIRTVLFKDPEASRVMVPDAGRMMDDMFRLARIADCLGAEDCIFGILPFELLYYNFVRSNRHLYMTQCYSEEAGFIRRSYRNPAVADFVAKADEAIRGGEYAADLRFGHDFPLMDLCCHLGIEGYDVSYNCENLDASWQGFRMMPMASNVQMILYRNAADDVLVKFLFQEREVKIAGCTPVCGPYYRWTEVKGKL